MLKIFFVFLKIYKVNNRLHIVFEVRKWGVLNSKSFKSLFTLYLVGILFSDLFPACSLILLSLTLKLLC